MPREPARRTAVYKIYDFGDILIYVGIGVDPEDRLYSHSQIQPWRHEIARHEITWYETRPEAKAEEARTVLEDNPVYNVRLRSSNLTEQMALRLTPAEVAAINVARGRHSRSEYLRRILLGAEPRLSGEYGPMTLPLAVTPAEATAPRPALVRQPGTGILVPVAPPTLRHRPRPDDCDHPKGRRLKGLCNACGTYVG